MFDFNSFPFALSGKTVAYICPKCKYKFDAPIEAVLEFEQEDEWNGLPISTHHILSVLSVILINAFQLIMYQREVFITFIRIIRFLFTYIPIANLYNLVYFCCFSLSSLFYFICITFLLYKK